MQGEEKKIEIHVKQATLLARGRHGQEATLLHVRVNDALVP